MCWRPLGGMSAAVGGGGRHCGGDGGGEAGLGLREWLGGGAARLRRFSPGWTWGRCRQVACWSGCGHPCHTRQCLGCW